MEEMKLRGQGAKLARGKPFQISLLLKRQKCDCHVPTSDDNPMKYWTSPIMSYKVKIKFSQLSVIKEKHTLLIISSKEKTELFP